ncbi:MAG: hypothetical protein M2R45_00092 [Verrucomicrobia subdivision 3 bacterium]|nr:hypothetical protein [Limisphaerales bacterium]MCS1412449.1 hypothetical protein [Limisphaerales bacterium]
MSEQAHLKRLDAADYSEFQNKLLKEKGGREQRNFLQAIQDRQQFLDRMKSIKEEAGDSVCVLPNRMSEREFNNPPPDTEQRIHHHWQDVARSLAASSSFWAYVTLEHVRERKIDADYLAAGPGNNSPGRERIDRALRPNAGEKEIDDCVRTVLRKLSGLQGVRGRRSVYVDCPLARSWWRQYLVSRAAKRVKGEDEIIGRVIRQSQTHWERFVSGMVSRNPVLGMENTQDALLVAMAKLAEQPPPASIVQSICQNFCIIGGSVELGIFEFSELKDIAEKIVDDVVESPAP